MTKEQLVAQLKLEYPALTYGINDEVFEMTADQYEETISNWADARISKAQAKADAEEAKTALLERLGITAEEAALLLG
jgi:hypothetical protein